MLRAFCVVALLGCSRPGESTQSTSPVAVEPAADPSPAPTPDTTDSACATLRAEIRSELCGDEAECEEADLPCSQQLDLDGDGKLDEVTFTRVDEKTLLRVAFGNGETSVLSEPFELMELPDLGQPWPPPSDERYPAELSWLAAWYVAKRDGDELVRQSRFRAGPALGDGLWMSGSDAAAMLVLSERGWLLIELGY